MSKRRRTNPNNKFVMLERWFWRCPAWQALPHPARSLYIELELLYDGKNNGDIQMGVRRAMRLLGTSVNFTRKMFAELEEKGFVKPNQRGSFSWKSRHETSWILTRYEFADKPPTSEYMRWKPAQKQKSVSPGESDGTTGRYRDAFELPPTVSPGDTVKADSDPPTVSPGDTSYSIPPVPSSEFQPRKERELCESAHAGAWAPHTKNSFAKLRGNRTAKATWLQAQIQGGRLSIDDVMDTLGIGFADVLELAGGKTTLGAQSWNKLAALAASRMN